MDYAFDYIKAGNKLELESAYPYTAKDGHCAYKATSGKGNIASYTDITPNDYQALEDALWNGPVAVAI